MAKRFARSKTIAHTRTVAACLAPTLLLLIITVAMAPSAGAKAREKVLYSFPNENDDHPTTSTLVIDKRGNLYGVASAAVDNGSVFRLIHSAGQWTESVIYAFKGGTDGSGPSGGLIFDKRGNLYGVTTNGGSGGCSGGCGTVFRLTPDEKGGWTEKVLYSFAGGSDGANPRAALIFDSAGSLYGTTFAGGDASCGCGTVFELTPGSGGTWSESVLHRFVGGKDGMTPMGGVVVDASGAVYGTASLGGQANGGVVFELVRKSGKWTETILHSFKGAPDGVFPAAGLGLFQGALYGTTYAGGKVCQGNITCGTVFMMKRSAGGKWTERVIHRFHASDGIESFATPVFDSSGNLYGTTFEGGSGRCNVCGTVFELAPSAKGLWHEMVLHDFGAYQGDAGTPEAGVIVDRHGHVFGTASGGGNKDGGAVYEVIP